MTAPSNDNSPTSEQCPATNASGRCHFGEGHTCGYHLFPDTPDGGHHGTSNERDTADAAAQPDDLLRPGTVPPAVPGGDLGGQVPKRAGEDELTLAGRSNDEPTDDPLSPQLRDWGQNESLYGRNHVAEVLFKAANEIDALAARLEAVTTERERQNEIVARQIQALINDANNQRVRAEIAEQRLDMARQALIGLDYFTPEQIGPDLGPRIVEYASHAEAETLRLRAQLDQIRDACDRAEAEGQNDAIERGVSVHVYSDVSTSSLRRIIGADSAPGSVTTTGRCDYRGADGSACDRPNGHADHADAQGHPVPWGVHTETNRCRWCGGENPLHRTDESGRAVLGGTE